MPSPAFDPREGYQVENPEIFVPWGISEEQLAQTVGDKLKAITGGYYTMSCVSLNGLQHKLGFHFSNGRLTIFEFFRESYPDYPNWKPSFDEFDRHLRETFGPPTRGGADSSEWNFGSVGVRHFMLDRYGPEERTYLCRLDSK